MYVVTFYSYQGGAGRTTALVSVATDLAMRGRKVLLVDFDLGKPALSSFGPLGSDRHRPGVVEFITEYLHLGRAPAVEAYVYQAKLCEEGDCPVWVMPAGRIDDNYWGALARLDWQDLYAVREGFLFMEDLKAQWRNVLQVDYVLIDAPAGIADPTSVCTRQLAEAVVFLVVLDQSDIGGMARVMKTVFAESIAEGPRRIDIHLVTSKVPDLDGDEPRAWRKQLGPLQEPEDLDILMFESLTAELPHDPALLFERQVVMSRRPRSRLARQYRRLANALIVGNCVQDREGARAFLKEIQLHPEELVIGFVDDWSEEQGRWFDRTRRLEQIIAQFTAKDENGRLLVDPVTAERNAEVLGQAASCLFMAGSRVAAADVLGVALEQSPANPALLWQQASYRLKGGDHRFVEDLLTLLGSPADQTPASLSQPTDQTPAALPQPTIEDEKLRDILAQLAVATLSRLPGLDTQPLRHDVLPLETVPGIDSYVVSAVRLLHRRAPERLEEALQRSRVRNLSQTERDRLLSEEIPESMYPNEGPEWLIGCEEFRQVIARLDPAVRGVEEPDVGSAFNLAMAYWAVGKEAEATCVSQKALKPWLAGGPQQLREVFDTTAEHLVLLQLFTLLAFRADNLEVANTLAIRLVGDLGEQFQGTHFFSYWRYKSVTFDQFREDCRDLQQMIRQRIANAPIYLPPFMSKSLSGV